ncbi:MAG: 30S ribosomal protein S21 [Planctomycetes bacterium]|jgi:ribosomal protein S21|nr:30S ribosomal protein S21 [Planctomycetota bacterium]
MADFKRKPGESFESFLRKFKKGLKNSKRLETAREKQFHAKKETKRIRKLKALTGLKLRKEREYLRKTGKLPEEGMNN